MKRIKYLYIVLLLFTLNACDREEWLDIKPTGVVIPTKVSDYRLLLDQVGQIGISPGFITSQSNTDLMTNDFYISETINPYMTKDEKRMYLWSDNIYDPNQEDRDWAIAYGQIYVTNIIVEEIMDAVGDSMAEKLQLEAEAKVHNAFAYFSLVNLYGLHYNPATAATDMAIPLRLNSDIEGVTFPRASVKVIYDLILDNLLTSIDLLPDLPDTNNYKNRPSKAAVYAFLSRVYLYMGNYEAAREAATNALSLNDDLLDYNEQGDYFFALEMPLQQDHPEVIWFKKSSQSARLMIINPEFYDLHDPADQRRRIYGELAGIFGIPGPDRIVAPPQFTGERHTGFNVPELLLTRAECNARLGAPSVALDDINRLRQYRIDPEAYTPLAIVDTDEVLARVKFERRLELAAFGLRYFDLKRYNVFDNANISMTHAVDDETVTLTAGSKNWALPVAAKYLLETPEIGPNERD